MWVLTVWASRLVCNSLCRIIQAYASRALPVLPSLLSTSAWRQLQKLKAPREFAAYQRRLLKGLQEKTTTQSDEAAPWIKDFLNEHLSFDSQAE